MIRRAAALAAIACCLWMPVVLMCLREAGSDHRLHVGFAEEFARTGRPPVPHFLYQFLVMMLAKAGVSFVTAAAVVVCAAICATAVLLAWRAGFRAGLAILLMAPVLPFWVPQLYTIGYFWAEVPLIPTYVLVQPFALGAVFLIERGVRPRWLIAMVVVLGALAKPSFLICLLPAVVLLYWRRRDVMWSVVAPGVAVLAVQFLLSFSGLFAGMYQNSVMWAPLKVLRFHSEMLGWKLLLSVLFPVAVWALYWRKAKDDVLLRLSTAVFLFGAAYGCLLAERHGWQTGNFLWSSYIGLFVLYAASVIFFARVCSWSLRDWVLLAVLLLHVQSGVRVAVTTIGSAAPHWRAP